MVFGVEPNEDMRRIAESKLSRYPRFKSVCGSAESTSLPDNSIDFIVAGQAFHWFRRTETKIEFRRILKVNGWVVLLWNTRKKSSSFLKAYEDLVNSIRADNSGQVKHEDLTDGELRAFLGKFKEAKLDNEHELDYEGLVGRILSASYSPLPGAQRHQELIQRIGELFSQYEQNGRVRFEYWTEIYAGQLR
jgi:SAM-dependent methyltransferase